MTIDEFNTHFGEGYVSAAAVSDTLDLAELFRSLQAQMHLAESTLSYDLEASAYHVGVCVRLSLEIDHRISALRSAAIMKVGE